MLINNNCVIVDGINFTPYLLQAKISYNKLWSSDSGRNLAGTQTGTLIGIFPKLELTFRKLTQNDLRIIAPVLDRPRQTTQYFDDNKQSMITITTYSSDWEETCKRIGKVSGVTVSLISTKRRT